MTVDSLLDVKNTITGLNNITLKKVNVIPLWYDKMYVDRDLIEDKMHQLIDQFNERQMIHNFYSELFENIHPFYDGNGRTFKILFVSNCNWGL